MKYLETEFSTLYQRSDVYTLVKHTKIPFNMNEQIVDMRKNTILLLFHMKCYVPPPFFVEKLDTLLTDN